jgi:hypothetical protein
MQHYSYFKLLTRLAMLAMRILLQLIFMFGHLTQHHGLTLVHTLDQQARKV